MRLKSVSDVFILALLIFPVLWFAFYAVSAGTDNLRMIRHFNADEAGLIEFAGRFYSRGIAPMEYACTYPHLFYYLAGLVLFPYTMLKGIDYRFIAISLRSFNVLITILTILFLYIFVRRFFKSRLTAALSCLIFGTTPQILRLTVHSKPHTLSVLFTVAAFYCCFKMIEKYSVKSLIYTVVFSALASATNLFGIFMIPSIGLAYFYHIAKKETSEISEYLKSRSGVIYFFAITIMSLALAVPLSAVAGFFKFQHIFSDIGINTIKVFLASRNFKILCLFASALFFTGVFWFIVNTLTGMLIKRKFSVDKFRLLLLINSEILCLFYVIFIIGLIFLILNPTHLFFPIANAKVIAIQFGMTTSGADLSAGINKPIFELSALTWITKLFDNIIFNKWFGLLLVIYVLYEVVTFKKNRLVAKQFVLQRSLLWAYVLFLLSTLIVCVFHRPQHYLLSLGLVISALLSFVVFDAPRRVTSAVYRGILISLFGLILILGFYERTIRIISLREVMTEKKADTALLIGKWLEDKFDKDATIWVDSKTYYIPPRFKNITSIDYYAEINKHFDEIKKINPDILIITSESDPLLSNFKKIEQEIKNGGLRDLKLFRTFRYEGPLELERSEYGTYKEVTVFINTQKL